MKARLSIPSAAKAFKFITDNIAAIKGMSEQELIQEIEVETGVSLTPGQLRTLTAEAGISLDTTERLGYYIGIAIAARMKWPIGPLISEGKKAESERIASIAKRNSTKALALDGQKHDDGTVPSTDPEIGEGGETPETEDQNAETDFPE